MAINVAQNPKCSPPGTMPKGGGKVTIVFTAHDPNSPKPRFLKPTYTIDDGSPYVFPTGSKIQVGPVRQMTVGQDEVTQVLTLKKIAGVPDVQDALLNITLQECIDAAGNPFKRNNVAVSPLEFSGIRITLV
jgi:hypothetical protein